MLSLRDILKIDIILTQRFSKSNLLKFIRASSVSNSIKDGATKNYIFPRIWINDDYNKNELPPTEDNQPLVVNVSIYLSSIIKIDDPTQVDKLKLV